MAEEITTVSVRMAALQAERLRVQRQITSYPMPIPACDAYFNHLLEERARICDELSSLRARAASPPDSR